MRFAIFLVLSNLFCGKQPVSPNSLNPLFPFLVVIRDNLQVNSLIVHVALTEIAVRFKEIFHKLDMTHLNVGFLRFFFIFGNNIAVVFTKRRNQTFLVCFFFCVILTPST